MINFEQEVIEQSHRVPVLVDFWAPWCGPCQFLGPILEKLAGEAQNQWVLVKVNTDEQPDWAQRYQVRGIPAVKLFHQGKVIAEFTGALPEFQLRQWLDKHLPNPLRDQLQELSRRLLEPDWQESTQAVQEVYNQHHQLPAAQLLYSLLLLRQGQIDAATLLLKNCHSQQFEDIERKEHLLHILEFLQSKPEGAAAQALEQAKQAWQQNKLDDLLEKLIQSVMLDKKFQNELPRRATLSLFKILGEDHPLSRQYRRRFDMALY